MKMGTKEKTKLKNRNKEIFECYHMGNCTMQYVGDKYGLTRERIRQIVGKFGPTRQSTKQEPFRYVKQCPECGKDFSTVNKAQKYCNKKCAYKNCGVKKFLLQLKIKS